MVVFLVVLHVLVCVFLILFVLLQPGARGGVGAAFGGAGGQTVFGGRGANTFLAKLTAAAAVVFMMTSISLSYFESSSTSVMSKRAPAGDVKKDDAKKDDAKKDDGDKPSGSKGDDEDTNESGKGDAPADKPVGDAPPAPLPPG